MVILEQVHVNLSRLYKVSGKLYRQQKIANLITLILLRKISIKNLAFFVYTLWYFQNILYRFTGDKLNPAYFRFPVSSFYFLHIFLLLVLLVSVLCTFTATVGTYWLPRRCFRFLTLNRTYL